jgi:RecA/RadA recombinase
MSLEFKKRNAENTLKKVLIYGYDGTGKSTFAAQYCKENNLNPVCIDVDDTNFTNVPLITLEDCNNSIRVTKKVVEIICDVAANNNDYDTIIIDGISSLFELLVGQGKGLSKYSERAANGSKIFRKLQQSNLNIIFIGQADMKVIINEDNAKPNKLILKVNSMVNEKYLCTCIDGKYEVETEKCRTIKGVEDGSL